MKTAVNKKPGKIETRLSMAVIALLAIVGAGVIVGQNQINPGVIALRPESRPQAQPSESDLPALIDTAGSGTAAFSLPERFGPETLYEKINGRADLYLSSGFASLKTQRFGVDEAAGAWVELYIYDMTTPENAFSVFSMQRREDAQAAGTVPNGYRTENAQFLVHDRFYLEIIGTDASGALQQAIDGLARAFVRAHGGATAPKTPGGDLFPEIGLQASSLQLVSANAFGYEQLDSIYTAEYLIDGARVTAFVSDRRSAEAASALADEYRQTLVSYGASSVDAPFPVDGAAVIRFFDAYEIIFSRGRYLAGVHEAGGLEPAGTVAGRLAEHLERLGE